MTLPKNKERTTPTVHARNNENYEVYLRVEKGSKELIVYDVGEESLPHPLKKKYIGFGNTTPKEMIQFL